MMPELFRIPVPGFLQNLLPASIPLYSYGLMLVIGFYVALELARFLARRSRIDPDVFVTAGMIALISGLLGARLSHVLENIHQYTDPSRSVGENFADAINFRSGGLTFYGGFIFATLCCIVYGLYKKIPVRIGMDIIAPCVLVGLGFGRIGCFLNGCCYGAECSVPWAVSYPYGSGAYEDQWLASKQNPPAPLLKETADGHARLLPRNEVAANPTLARIAADEHARPVHPAQLYSAFTAFLIAALCVAYYALPHVPGRVFALMLMVEGTSRYILEMLRAEPAVVRLLGHGLSFSMVLSVGLVIGGIALWFIFGRVGGRWPVDAANAGARRAAMA